MVGLLDRCVSVRGGGRGQDGGPGLAASPILVPRCRSWLHCLQRAAGVKVALERYPPDGLLASAFLFTVQWLGVVIGGVLPYGEGCSKLLCRSCGMAHVLRACGELQVAVVSICSACDVGEVAHRCSNAGLRW